MNRKDIKRRPMADRTLNTLEPENKEYREFDSEGLYFRVTPNGKKSWQLRYKDPSSGKWSWYGMGSYGTGVGQLTGEQARKKARTLLVRIADGENIGGKKQKVEADDACRKPLTFEHLANEWIESQTPKWTDGTTTRVTGALRKHILPTFGNRNFSEITAMEWIEHFRQMQATGILEQTGRVCGICRNIYDLALVTGRVNVNPIAALHKFLQTHRGENFAHVASDELAGLIRAIRAYPHATDVRIGLQLLMLLTCRPSELREARWSEFDLEAGIWDIPKERMKMRRPHVIPLPKQAQVLLRELHHVSGSYPLLFPGRNDNKKPRSNTVFLMALRRLGYEGRQTGHGFRHIASTLLHENGFNSDIVEAQLAHAKAGVRGVYDKSIYLQQRAKMLQWYADHLDELTNCA